MNATLKAFINLLKAMDEVCDAPNWFNYKVKQISANRFSYEFDSLIHCEAIFHKDGTVTDVVDGYPKLFPSIYKWATAVTKRVK